MAFVKRYTDGFKTELFYYQYAVDKYGASNVKWINQEEDKRWPYDMIINGHTIDIKKCNELAEGKFYITTVAERNCETYPSSFMRHKNEPNRPEWLLFIGDHGHYRLKVRYDFLHYIRDNYAPSKRTWEDIPAYSGDGSMFMTMKLENYERICKECHVPYLFKYEPFCWNLVITI